MLSALPRQINALTVSAAIALGSTLLVSLPLLASDNPAITGLSEGYYSQNVATMFQRTGAMQQGMSFDSTTVESSPFDFAAYVSHTCYRPTEHDMPRCQELFGPYADLRWTLETGRLAMILKRYAYLASAATLVPQPTEEVAEEKVQHSVVTPTTTTAQEMDTTDEAERLRSRAKQVWESCSVRSISRSDAVRCYQRNVRLTTVRSEMVPGNVY